MKKQTAVEWLVQELTRQNMFMHLFAKEIEQAKEMELKQRIDDYNNGHIDRGRNIFNSPKKINNEQII